MAVGSAVSEARRIAGWSRRPTSKSFSPGISRGNCYKSASHVGVFRFWERSTVRNQPQLLPDLQQWLDEQGLPHQDVILADCGVAGRGLVAASGIRKGEPLLKIPDLLLLSADKAILGSCLKDVLLKADLPEWSVLAVHLVELRWRSQREASSPWARYIEILPADPSTVLSWPRHHVPLLLAGSPLLLKAESILAAADTSWEELQPLMEAAEKKGIIPPHVFTRAAMDWGFGILLSRLIRLPSLGGLQALIPWADFLNHQSSVSSHLDWDAGRQAVVLLADRDYRAGEQVYVSYGTKTSGELLLSYGFAPPPSNNPHESYLMEVGLTAESGPVHEAKLAALQLLGLPPSKEFPLRADGYPDGLLQWLAFCVCPLDDPSDAIPLSELLLLHGAFPRVDGRDTRILALRELSARCRAALQGYTSVDCDYKELMDGTPGTASTAPTSAGWLTADDVCRRRVDACNAIRAQEIRILNRTRFFASSYQS